MSCLATKSLLLFLVLYASICLASSVPDEYSISNVDLDKFTSEKEVFHLFQMWKKEIGREYQTLEEEATRFQIFKSKLKYIRERNRVRKYRLGLNNFSDMSYEEFSKIYLHETEEPIMKSNNSKMVLNNTNCPDAPPSFDWGREGAVTDVKNQNKCQSCWAFSATGAMEGINQIVSGKLLALSEQQLISCSKNNGSCNRGWWYGYAFQYVIDNGGIASEGDYPYTADNSSCNYALEQKKSATIDDYNYWNRKPISESSLQCFVFKQPVSVSLYASEEFQNYNGGIFSGNDCLNIGWCTVNHAVLITGYGSTDNGEDFGIVKNSWGLNWGQHGYISIERNIGAPEGVCNINCNGAYPTKGKKETPVV